ncbi:MAG: hypothetical protein C0600_16140 [Ignavibacteria bacterium]|nr:MAG: hypothetical protein C0600_16140 [Ignavibacteria bacterium]
MVYLTPQDEEEQRIELPEGTHLTNTILFTYLTEAFADPARKEYRCKMLQVRDAEVQDYTYKRLEDESLQLVDKTWDALVVEETNHATGLQMTLWVDKPSSTLLKVNILGRNIYRTDPSVVKRIKVGDLDKSILVKTNKSIADVQGITAMKVRAKLQPVGLSLTEAGLNGPGQSFTGTVDENAVDGVFEIAHARYGGENAPAFPPDYSGNEDLQQYLEPSRLCESDDVALAEKARELTTGAIDSWDAAKRLSSWVATNISYAIPGGGSAKKTFEVRAGECGAHSLLLAAMCRSVGIPARVVWGCMYTPNLGGSFGQHAWNEIYMGGTGWIPVDATAHETDFVDSGHLRVAEMESIVISLNADEFEILDYELAGGPADASNADRLAPYLGEYSSAAVQNKTFTILEENGKLALNIENKMTLAFKDPDEEGCWQCQLAPQLTLMFAMDADGRAESLTLHEQNRMARKKGITEELDGVPDELKPCIGTFVMRGPNLDFRILYQDGSLVLREPKGGTHVLEQGKAGVWTVDNGSRKVEFETAEDGSVTAILATHATMIPRKSE